jgi:hypothetical protein
MQPLKDIRTEMLTSESGTGSQSWIAIGLAILLFLSMTRLEGLIYCSTGGGFLLP